MHGHLARSVSDVAYALCKKIQRTLHLIINPLHGHPWHYFSYRCIFCLTSKCKEVDQINVRCYFHQTDQMNRHFNYQQARQMDHWIDICPTSATLAQH